MEVRVRDLSLQVSEQRAELPEDTSSCPHANKEPAEHSRNKGPWPHCLPSAHHPGPRPTEGHPAPRTSVREDCSQVAEQHVQFRVSHLPRQV